MTFTLDRVYDLVALGETLYQSHPGKIVTILTTSTGGTTNFANQISDNWTRTGNVFYQLAGKEASIDISILSECLSIIYESEDVMVNAVVYGSDVTDETDGLLGYLQQIFRLEYTSADTLVGY